MKMIVYIVEILYDLWHRIQYKTHFSTKLSGNGGMKINDDNDGAFRGRGCWNLNDDMMQ